MASSAVTTITFPRFPDFPLEIQLYIWDLVLQDFTFVHIEWGQPQPHTTTTATTTLCPVLAIPQLGEGDQPGLIPHVLPPGMPATLGSHPLPLGFPSSRARGVDWKTYMDMMLRSSKKLAPDPAPGILYHFNRVWSSFSSSSSSSSSSSAAAGVAGIGTEAAVEGKLGEEVQERERERERGRGRGRRGRGRSIPGIEGFDDVLACLSVCRTSRQQTLRRAIVNTRRSLLQSQQQPQQQQSDTDTNTNTNSNSNNTPQNATLPCPINGSSGSSDGSGNGSGSGSGEGSIPLLPARNGVVLGSVFQDQDQGRPCLVYAIAPNKTDFQLPPVVGRDFHPFAATGNVAARLSDIERCVFGRRLSLDLKHSSSLDMDRKRFATELQAAMWWRPELGARARRPEANHPMFSPPASILWVYSVLLHHIAAEDGEAEAEAVAVAVPELVKGREEEEEEEDVWDEEGGDDEQEKDDLAACLLGEKDWMYLSGEWYFDLLETGGTCSRCHAPLMDALRRRFPDLLDAEGCLDVVILRDRDSVEHPEATIGARSHEDFL